MGGLDDRWEGRYNSLSQSGRQKIAAHWKPEMIKIGNQMLRGKPADIRAILDSDLIASIDGEDVGKFFRFAMETAKIDNFLKRKKPLAIIIKGNPKFLEGNKLAAPFYDKLKRRLEKQGYEVKFDAGLDKTLPDTSASLWVGHSRGTGRFKYAPKGIQTLEIKTNAYAGDDPRHYEISLRDSAALNKLKAPLPMNRLSDYKTGLALEQDASSSGAQIIALTTKNRKLAELSNVVPTNQKQRLNFDLFKFREFRGTLYESILSRALLERVWKVQRLV